MSRDALPDDTPERRAALVAWALVNGYAVERRSLYDEEGVEGWAWTSPSGESLGDEIGLWDEVPAMPDGLFDELNEACGWRYGAGSRPHPF